MGYGIKSLEATRLLLEFACHGVPERLRPTLFIVATVRCFTPLSPVLLRR